jgi:hypothetical protein
VCGHEDDHRHPFHAVRTKDPESVQARHLDVEEHEVRLERRQGAQGLASVPAFAHDRDVPVRPQQLPHPSTGERLVIHDQRPDFSHR